MSRVMDPKAHCQNLLMRFRVIELKELLRSIGQSTKGRKPELMQRSTHLLRDGGTNVQDKIKEIWGRSHSFKKPDNYQKMAQRYTPMKGTGHTAQHRHHYNSHTHHQFQRGPYVIHPDVTFKNNPFYVKLDTIIRPTALVPTSVTSMGSDCMRLEFHLTPLQVQKVYSSRTPRGDYNTQVVMRFCRYETSNPQEDFLPRNCVVRINGQFLPTPTHTHNRPDYQRRCNPLDITHYIKTTPTHTNDVTIMWNFDDKNAHGFVTAIELADTLSSSDLLNKLKAKGVRNPGHTRTCVVDKLSVDKDSEISATSLKVSLICPLGKLRITNPCRANGCEHLQCFDASIYLQMNERKARWVCPVCDKPAPFESLEIDGLFKEICESSPHNDIEFSADGSWHPFSNKPGSSNYLSSPEKKAARYSPVLIRDVPDDVEMDGVGGTSGRGQKEPSGPVVIDLTLSSDEEDEAPPRPSAVRRQSSSSSSTSTSSCEERDDVITTTLNTSGCVTSLRSTTPPRVAPSRAVARRSSSNTGDGVITGRKSSRDRYDDSNERIFNHSEVPSSLLLNKDWPPLANASSLQFLIPPSFRLNAPSGNSLLQVITTQQSTSSRSSGISLLTTASEPLSSSSSSSTSTSQPLSVITSCATPSCMSLPFQPFQPSSSELNSDPFLPYFNVDDNLLR